MVNRDVNRCLSASREFVVVEAGPPTRGCANLPQDMRIWRGIVLMAVCKTSDAMLRNGLQYHALDWAGDDFKLACINDDAQLLGEPSVVSREVVAEKLRLMHALCYFSTQARTIRGPLRLAQTDHPHFGIWRLIVGLGRAPDGSCVEVE